MLFSVNDLFGFSVEAEDFKAAIVDAFVERESMQIKHLAIDIGGLLSNKTVVIAADKVSEIDADNRKMTLRLTKADVEKLDVIDEATLTDGLQLSDIPALLLGPSSEDVARTFLAQNAPDGALLSAQAVGGSVACHGTEDVGKVIGLIAETENLKVTHVAVDTGVSLPETQRVLPMSLVESIGDGATKTALSIDAKTLGDSPQLENITAIDRHWIDKVASYYGLS